MIQSYGQVFNLGHQAIAELFLDPVLIEEKIDGSQFSFGIVDDVLQCRSHHKPINLDAPNMFAKAVDTVKGIEPLLHPGWIYRCEFLSKPHHNCLCYERVPKGNLIVYDIDKGIEDYLEYEDKVTEVTRIGLECVPSVKGIMTSLDELRKCLDLNSCLGGTKVEGVVIKNYSRFGIDKHCLMGKLVSDSMKERISKGGGRGGGKGIIQLIGLSLKTEARWNKAIQHLREQGLLTNTPQDIGPLFREVNIDILKECSDEIVNELFKWAWPSISRLATKGLAEFYKELLAKGQFTSEKGDTK